MGCTPSLAMFSSMASEALWNRGTSLRWPLKSDGSPVFLRLLLSAADTKRCFWRSPSSTQRCLTMVTRLTVTNMRLMVPTCLPPWAW